jgi:hypothetical protein
MEIKVPRGNRPDMLKKGQTFYEYIGADTIL